MCVCAHTCARTRSFVRACVRLCVCMCVYAFGSADRLLVQVLVHNTTSLNGVVTVAKHTCNGLHEASTLLSCAVIACRCIHSNVFSDDRNNIRLLHDREKVGSDGNFQQEIIRTNHKAYLLCFAEA